MKQEHQSENNISVDTESKEEKLEEENNKPNSERQLTRRERKLLIKKQLKEGHKQEKEKLYKSKKIKKVAAYSFVALIVAISLFFFFKPKPNIVVLPEDDPFIGNASAGLTIIEFGDFKCPFTKSFNQEIMPVLLKEYEGKIRFVYKDMPTGKHGNSFIHGEAAECADDHGKFREYHDLLFQNQFIETKAGLIDLARKVDGIDIEKFKECLNSGKYKQEVKDDYKLGKKINVAMTPTLLIGGDIINGVIDLNDYKNIINNHLNNQK